MMSLNVINDIRNQIKQIPSEKDRKIANTFLDKRDFNSLKELVDSDVILYKGKRKKQGRKEGPYGRKKGREKRGRRKEGRILMMDS